MAALAFMKAPLLDDGERTDYAGKIAILKDDDLVDETETQIYDAGWDRTHGPSDQRCTELFREAERRGKPWLYCRGYNAACDRAMMPVDAVDRARAREPIAA